jgi:hypothetical protein
MTTKECRTGIVRRYRSRSEAAALVAEFGASGLTRQQFSKRNDVAINTLNRYIRRYGHGTTTAEPQQLIRIDIAESAGVCAALTVVLRRDRRIEVAKGFDTTTLEQVVRVLERF